MKIVLGVDRANGSEAPPIAVSLLHRLRFPQAAIDVVHVRTPEPYSIWGVEAVMSAVTYDSIEQEEAQAADHLVGRVAVQIRDGMPKLPEEADPALVRNFVLMEASVAGGLLKFAESDHADLIAVDGPQSGPWLEFMTGSIARALVVDAQPNNVLLAKEGHHQACKPMPKTSAIHSESATTARGVRAVFATDHSPYANRCVKELLRLAPAGISHLTILTAYPEDDLAATHGFLSDLAVRPETAVRLTLENYNQDVLRRLEPLLDANDATSESRVVGLPVNQAIQRTMEEAEADLLILGASGHGFLERLSLGSVAFHHAMSSPYSLLILRAK